MKEASVTLADGHVVHVYDRPAAGADALPVFWLHGTPNLGPPPAPLFADADRLGLRWLGYDRPGYGGSTPRPGRDIASAARDIAAIADHLGLARFAVMGHSGGGPHALACAALLPDRVVAAVSAAGLAPFGVAGLDWFDGMHPAGVENLRAALAGRDAKLAFEAARPAFDPTMFTDADWEALQGPWAWFHEVVGPAQAQGPDGLLDDDLAYVTPWGLDCASIARPVLLLHGGQDRVIPANHAQWLAAHCPAAELWLQADDGHLSVLRSASRALAWLKDRADVK